MKRFKRFSNEALVFIIIVQWLLVIPKLVFDYSLFNHMLIEFSVTSIYFIWLYFPEIKRKLIKKV